MRTSTKKGPDKGQDVPKSKQKIWRNAYILSPHPGLEERRGSSFRRLTPPAIILSPLRGLEEELQIHELSAAVKSYLYGCF